MLFCSLPFTPMRPRCKRPWRVRIKYLEMMLRKSFERVSHSSLRRLQMLSSERELVLGLLTLVFELALHLGHGIGDGIHDLGALGVSALVRRRAEVADLA